MSKGEIQYIADTLFINEFDHNLNQGIKQAGVLDTLSSAVNTYVLSNIDRSSPGALIKSVVDLLAPAVFFRVNPLFGVLYTLAQSMFGLSLTSVLTTITSKIIPIITSGEKVTPDQINDAGRTLVTASNNDFFADLKQIEKQAQFFGNTGRTQPTGGSFLSPPKNAPVLEKMFGFLGQAKSKNLLVGFVVWLVKTILLSAGLLAVGGATSKLLGFNKKPEEPAVSNNFVANYPGQQTLTNNTPAVKSPSTPMVGLQPSGKGQEYYTNDMNSMWVIPLNGKRLDDFLVEWTTEIYPQLRGYEDIIREDQSFQRALSLLGKNYSAGKDLIVPPGFSRMIDIVNQFSGNVWNNVLNRIKNV